MNPRAEQLPRRSTNIFINYRREDSAGHAGRLFDRLSSRFPGRVFMDIDTIQPGIDFVDTIEHAVGCCEVLIVMIGRDWLFLTDATGRRRLDNPNDFVRLEIAAALERNIRIIPVLVEGAPMPQPEDLPPDLARLTRRNAIELSDARWTFDVDRLLQAIEGVLQEKAPSALLPAVKAPAAPAPSAPPAPVRRGARPRAPLAVPVLILLMLAGWSGWSLAGRPNFQEIQEATFLLGLIGHVPPPQEVTRTEVTPEKATRPPKNKDVAVRQGKKQEPASQTSESRISSVKRWGKNTVKSIRDRMRPGSGKKEGRPEDSKKQGG